MRKLCLVAVVGIMLLMAGFVLADEKEPINSTGKTVFTNLAVVGVNVSQVPGYLEFTDNSSTPARYYLWVGSDGKLRISSGVPVGVGASPADVTLWANTSGTVVGLQS